MDRRKFLKAAPQSALALAAAGTLAAPALAQGKRQLKMVTAWPPNYPGLGTSANRFAQRVADLTDGAVTIKVFAANELVGAFETFDAVSNGAADMYHAADYYWQGKSPAYNFFTATPMNTQPGSIMAGGRNCGTSLARASRSSRCKRAIPACKWAVGSTKRSPNSTISRA
jgi:TRAP-type mannitol/chloroaromatic compound transport system substrate-binding protein